ncbi:Uncharacterised protein [Burkholderia pseudomallei]|nr:Uncharacterised protein [Burkholderia pseudomallei]
MPHANSRNAARPAIGSSVFAAWRVVAMSCTPCAKNTADAVSMMQNATTFDASMPTHVSIRIRRPWPRDVLDLRDAPADVPARLSCAISSTSSAACQTNRYGLIVVPSTATAVVAYSCENAMRGATSACATAAQSTSTSATSIT